MLGVNMRRMAIGRCGHSRKGKSSEEVNRVGGVQPT